MTNVIYRLVPAGTWDAYAAGFDDNRFESMDEAIATIPALRATGPEFDHEWEVLVEEEDEEHAECAHEDESCGCADERATGLEYEAAMQRAGYR